MKRALGVAVAVAVLIAGVAIALEPDKRSDLRADPSTLNAVFAKAKGGEVIDLAPGLYGTFSGATRARTVTLRGDEGGDASIAIDLDGASFLRFENLTIRSAELQRSRHIAIAGSRFTGAALVDTTDYDGDHDILFDGNAHRGIDVCDGCHEGRLTVVGDAINTRPVGVTIRNSFFGDGGNSDGVQVGSYGVRVLNNEFAGLTQGDPGRAHTDAIQLFGQTRTVVRGNFLHDVATGIMAADGSDHELIEHNVIVTNGYPWGIVLGPDQGSTVRNNTLPGGSCNWDQPCGTLRVCATCNPAVPSRDTIIRDNVLGALALEDGSTPAVEDYNLVATAGGTGAHDVTAPAGFAGGPDPHRLAGYALDDASPGASSGSDGRDRGAHIPGVGPAAR